MNTFLFEEPATTSSWPLLLILGVFLIGMMAFSVIPQRRKQKQMAEMSSRIKVGDKIKTIGGIFGTIIGLDEENNVYTIISGNSTFEIDRGCVYSMEMMGAKSADTTAKAPEDSKAAEEEVEDIKKDDSVEVAKIAEDTKDEEKIKH